MTPTERAEKIMKWIDEGGVCQHTPENKRCWSCTAHAIGHQIEEAVREGQQFYYDEITEPAIRQAKAEGFAAAQKDMGINLDVCRRERYMAGWIAGREKAAELAHDHPADENGTDVCRAIEQKIRAMEPDK